MTNIHSVFIANWHPTLLNKLVNNHWATAAKYKKHDRQMVASYTHTFPKAAGKRHVTLQIVLGYRQKGGDVDAYWKSLLDGLVSAGMLVDDSRHYCETAPVKFTRNRDDWGSRITLEDVL